MSTKFMDIATAFQIVLDLARQNIIDERDCDDNEILLQELERQVTACNIIEDLAVNEYGDE
jgi:hypothetical protein